MAKLPLPREQTCRACREPVDPQHAEHGFCALHYADALAVQTMQSAAAQWFSIHGRLSLSDWSKRYDEPDGHTSYTSRGKHE